MKAANLIDASFLTGFVMLALSGWVGTFASPYFLVVGLIAVVLGIAAAHVASALRWHWLAGFGLASAIYFLLGGVVALRADLIAGVLPSARTVANLAALAVRGWKGLLTTLPPVAGDSDYLVLVWLLGLVAGVAGYGVARAKPSPQLALVVPAGLFALVNLLGDGGTAGLLVRGLGFGAVAASWTAVRATRQRRLIATGAARASRLASAAVLVAVSLVAGALLGPMLPGTTQAPRWVLRDLVRPPLQVSQYPSPLPGLVKYSSPLRQQYYNVTLATIEGATAGSQVRFTVLDQYTSLGWSASGTSVYGDGFRRVGVKLPVDSREAPVDIQITVTPEYAAAWELRNWVPSLGPTGRVAFIGDDAASHLDSMAYDKYKGQILLTDGLRGGDTVSLTTYPVPLWQQSPDGTAPIASGLTEVPDTVSDFLADSLAALTGDATTSWGRLMNVGRALSQGYWSDGSRPNEGQYLPGNSLARLDYFMRGKQFIGSDEQYAAVFALAANRFGYPARVVFGATIEPGGVIMGKDVTAWVEIQTSNGWVAMPTDLYMPDRDRTPDQIPPDQTTQNQATQVPPPNPAEPPSSLDELATQATAGQGNTPIDKTAIAPAWVRPAIYSGAAGLGVVLLLMLFGGAKAVRAHRRRSNGTPVQRIAGGWRELLDRARDMGAVVPSASLTRSEQAHHLDLAPLAQMAPVTDRVMFGPDDPDAAAVADYWHQVDSAKAALLRTQPRLRRLVTRLTPRSLLPQVRR